MNITPKYLSIALIPEFPLKFRRKQFNFKCDEICKICFEILRKLSMEFDKHRLKRADIVQNMCKTIEKL